MTTKKTRAKDRQNSGRHNSEGQKSRENRLSSQNDTKRLGVNINDIDKNEGNMKGQKRGAR